MALLETLQDDWSSGSIDSGRWPDVSNATYVVVSGGVLSVTTPAATTQYNYAQSGLTWDLTNSYIYAKVVTATVSGGGTGSQETYLMVSKDVSNQMYVYRGGNVLYRGIKTAGTAVEAVMNATYNATNQAWWRIRHSSTTGLVYFAYSADAVNWTESGGQSVSWVITAIRATLMVGKFTAADAAGTGTFDNVNINGYPSPTAIAVGVSLDDPQADFAPSAPADGVAVPLALDDPAAAADANPATPTEISVPVTLDAPTANVDAGPATPVEISVPVALDPPSAAVDAGPATPTEIAVPATLDPPTADFVSDAAALADGVVLPVALDAPTADVLLGISDLADGIAIPLALDAPGSAFDANPVTMLSIHPLITLDPPQADFAPSDLPDGIVIPVALDAPAAAVDAGPATPDEIAVAVTLDPPTADYASPTVVLPDGVALPVALDAPAAAFDVVSAPVEIGVPVTLDAPTALYTAPPTDLPDGVVVPLALDVPGAAFDTGAAPDGIPVPVAFDDPTGDFLAATAPDEGPALPIVFGPISTEVLVNIATAPTEIYLPIILGPPETASDDDRNFVDPVVPRRPYLRPVPPFHIMGVGPADSAVVWRGAPNYGLANTGGLRPSRPSVILPEAQSKSFTLRLNGASEARADHEIDRDAAIVIQELATDLWWRRRDPARKVVDSIGRFNADKVDLSYDGEGTVRLSASWIDYQGLLIDRLYLNTQVTYAKGASVVTVLTAAIPTNAGIDLTNLAGAALGTLREAFDLVPGATVGDVMTNVETISTVDWEWWVDMPAADGGRPILMFATSGGRGADRGITLFNIGSGQAPVESWHMQAGSDKYANSIYFAGADTGVVYQLAADIAQYGQRDTTENDTTLKGTTAANVATIGAAATKKLTQLSDRTPTWTLDLRSGFWEGRTHIDVGDWVTVYIKLGQEVLAGKHRVTEIHCDVDASGDEKVSLTLGFPRPSRDPRSRVSSVAKLVRKIKNATVKGTT